jgi:hypothetical protein
LSARITKLTYLSVTTMMIDQRISETMPNTFCWVMPPAAFRHSRSVYSGLVPISPNTTPIAPSTRLGAALTV